MYLIKALFDDSVYARVLSWNDKGKPLYQIELQQHEKNKFLRLSILSCSFTLINYSMNYFHGIIDSILTGIYLIISSSQLMLKK